MKNKILIINNGSTQYMVEGNIPKNKNLLYAIEQAVGREWWGTDHEKFIEYLKECGFELSIQEIVIHGYSKEFDNYLENIGDDVMVYRLASGNY